VRRHPEKQQVKGHLDQRARLTGKPTTRSESRRGGALRAAYGDTTLGAERPHLEEWRERGW
jgi:hypothetical protein